MASVLNKVTKQYIASANTPDYDPAVWIINPNITSVRNIDPKYWIIQVDNTVRVMTKLEMVTAYLGDAKRAKKDEVNAYRDRLMDMGYSSGGHVFDSDQYSALKIVGATLVASILLSKGQDFPSDFVWRDADNIDVHMNAITFVQFGIGLFTHGVDIYKASWTHKANIDALTSIDDIDQYDITINWPA